MSIWGAAEKKAMNQHIVRTLGYTGIFVVFVAAAGATQLRTTDRGEDPIIVARARA
jgi:hypothetical protein